MDKLILLLDEFWNWTGLPREKWWNVDISDLPIDSTQFDQYGEICNECIKLVNSVLRNDEIQYFLMGLAINSEDEDILDFMKKCASDIFLYNVISIGISYPQADARWQLTELLRREIPERPRFFNILLNDPDEYVRKRAKNIFEDIFEDELF